MGRDPGPMTRHTQTSFLMRTVATYSMPSEALAPMSRLQSAGIAANLRDDATLQMNWMWSNAIGGVKLEVPDEDFASARELLGLAPSAAGALQCPYCGSTDVSIRTLNRFTALSLLLVGAPLGPQRTRAECQACGRSHTPTLDEHDADAPGR